MQTFASIANGVVAAIVDIPDGLTPGKDVYTPEYAATLVSVPAADAGLFASGWAYANGAFSAPAPSGPVQNVPAQVTDKQFFQAAAVLGIITQAEAIAFMANGAMPANLAAAIASLPSAEQFPATMAVLGAHYFYRNDPFVLALSAAMGETSAQVDALFTLAATL